MHSSTLATKPTSTILLSLLMALCSHAAFAQDISNEQRDAYEARQAYNKKLAAHQSLLTQISQQEKRVEQAQARLDKLRAAEQKENNELNQAKVDLVNAVNTLNGVWELRDR